MSKPGVARHSPSSLCRLAWFCCCWILTAPQALALDSHFRIGDYRHDVWGAKEGAPAMTTAMAQTSDGWLWLGTTRGLYRFDGATFERFVPLPGEALTYNGISTMFAAPNGDLLIGYLLGGFSILRNGHVINLTSVQNRPFSTPFSVRADPDGTFWVGAGNGLRRLRGTTWEIIGKNWDYPTEKVENMVLDQYGRLFVGDGRQLFLLDREKRKFHPVGPAGDSPGLIISPDGQLWRREGTQLSRFDLPHAGPALARLPQAASASMAVNKLFDRDGNLWLSSCPEKVCMVRREALPAGPTLDTLQLPNEQLAREGKPGNSKIHGMLEDRDGNLWIATPGGLERLRHHRLATIAYPGGTSGASIARNRAGDLLVAMNAPTPLHQIDGGTLRPVAQNPTTQLLRGGLNGTLLLARPDGLVVQGANDERLIAYPPPAAPEKVVRLVQEGPDSFWAGLAGRPSFRYADGQWSKPDQYGLPLREAASASNGDGHVWLSYSNNRIFDFSAAGVREYNAASGVDVRVAQFLDVQRETLASGDGGLQVLSGGRFRHVHAADPDVLAGINGVWVAPNGDRWLNGPRGVLHVLAKDWQTAMREPDSLLRYDLLDQLDGYPGTSQISNVSTVAAMPDGRMWFVASGGIAVYDPRHDHRAVSAPPPVIRVLTVDQRRYSPFEKISLPAGTERLAIAYTALSYTMPERTVFRYRLDGVDQGWQAPLSRRDISYVNLGPGKYRFVLQAAIAGGAWSDQSATLQFEIAPRFTQTWWFMLLCALGLLGLAVLLHRWRLRQVMSRLLSVHRERQRIARTLHDTFLQSLQALVWGFESIKQSLPKDAAGAQLLDTTLLHADQVMAEGRRQILDLRPAATGADALDARLAVLAATLRTRFSCEIYLCLTPQTPVPLQDAVASEAYHIAHEAIMNALNHGPVGTLEIALSYAPAHFTLQVTDDGGGIDASILAAGGKSGHWGLTGMRERARGIGGKVSIANTGDGTEVTLQLPARAAYAKAGGNWLRKLLPWRHRA